MFIRRSASASERPPIPASSTGGASWFGLSQKANAFLISGLMLFLALAGFHQSREQHRLVRDLNARSEQIAGALADRLSADRDHSERTLEDSIADVTASVSPDMVAADDVPGLQTYADILVRSPNVEEVAFIDTAGRVIAGARDPILSQESSGEYPVLEHSRIVLERPIQALGQTYGTFRLVVTDHNLRLSAAAGRQAAAGAAAAGQHAAARSLARADVTMVLATVVLGLLMAVLSTLLFRHQIGRPLGAITRALERLAGGDMDAVIPGVGRRDEIGDIAAAAQIFKDSMMETVRLAAANQQLTHLSSTDGLTGIANRRAFDVALKTEWDRATRAEATLALIMIDVDFFKLYNDRYGHLAGDDCLCRIAQMVSGALLRPTDLAVRYGGEEFAALLPNTDEGGARAVGERLRQSIHGAALPHAAAPGGVVSVSVGVASLAALRQGDPQALIRLADGALYDAKQGGRNQVRGPTDPPVLHDDADVPHASAPARG